MASEAKCESGEIAATAQAEPAAPTAQVEEDSQPSNVEESAGDAVASLHDAVASLRDALAQAQADVEAQKDRALRAVAEAENVRKRSERAIENAHKYALDRFVADLLPAVDSFERAAEAAGEADAEGIRLSLKLLVEAMQRQGIAVVDPIGAPFDPNLHEAMTMIESPAAEPGSVVEVFQKGYTVNGRLTRPARVIVAKHPAPAEPPTPTEASDDA